MNNYIHYRFKHYDGLGIPTEFTASSLMQAKIDQRINRGNTKTSYRSITLEGAELLTLVREDQGIEDLLHDVLNETEKKLNSDFTSSDFEKYFDLENNTSSNFFENIEKIVRDNNQILTYKEKLENILNGIATQLGKENYGELGKMIIANVKNNYGYEISEQQIYKDFLMNCDSKYFTVNKNYVGKLTDSINKIYLLAQSLPVLGKTGKLNFKIKTLTLLGNRTVGWITKCSDVIKDIAISKVANEIKHDLAVALEEGFNSLKGNKDIEVEIEEDLKNFIQNNKPLRTNFSKNYDGIKITSTDSYVEIEIDMQPYFSPLEKQYANTRDISNIRNSEKMLDAIDLIEGATQEGILNLSSSHAMSSSEESNLQNVFNQTQQKIAQMKVLYQLTSLTDNDYYIINGKVYSLSELLQVVLNDDKSVFYKLTYDRKKLVQLNRWESVYQNDWDNAYLRSGKNELIQHSNLMTYEFNLMESLK